MVDATPEPDPDAPVTFSQGGPGQSAFMDGICRVLGFRATLEIAPTLRAGRPVLLHGWQPHYDTIIRSHPGKTWSVWHSGWAGSDVMGEGHSLAVALAHLRAGSWGIFWLEERDVLPRGASYLAPVWSPIGMSGMLRDRPEKSPRSVIVALHGAFASAAKNILASVAACLDAGARVEISQNALDQPLRGEALHEMLRGTSHVVHPVLDRLTAIRVLAGADLLVHPSVCETWPYQPMEAIYSGTPCVVSEAIPWAAMLPADVRARCVIASPKHSADLAAKVRALLASADLRAEVLAAQRTLLDVLAAPCAERAARQLRAVGFCVGDPRWT